ncbi:MAG: sulfatase/phosphatase domain-containing protein, partial [Planctomycetota bacterium]
GAGWDGSLNDPLNGEKGMLSEGGMHVPFVVSWPGKIKSGQEYEHPISTLDVAATAVALAGLEKEKTLDGVNLVPFLSGETTGPPHECLTWRWGAQSAIREGNWKLLRGGDREYLYDLSNDLAEKQSVLALRPMIAGRLREKLRSWTSQLSPPGLATQPMSTVWDSYFDFYLEGKPAPPLREKFQPRGGSSAANSKARGWLVRKGNVVAKGETLVVESQGGFLARSGLKLRGPLTLELETKTSGAGPIQVSWRSKDEPEFAKDNRVRATVEKQDDFQSVRLRLPDASQIIHLRIYFPGDRVEVRSLRVEQSDGTVRSLTD